MRRAMTALVAATIGAAGIGLTTAGAQDAGSMTVTPSSGPVGAQVLVEGVIDCEEQPAGDPVFLGMRDPDAGPQTAAGLGETPLGADGSFSKTVTIPDELQELQPGVGIFPVPVVAKTYTIRASCGSSLNTVSTPFTVTEGGGSTTTAPTSTSTTAVTTPTTAGGGTTTTTSGFTPPPAPPTDADPLTSAPTTVTPGGTVQISEGGFVPGEDVPVVLYSTPTVLATLTASATGQVQGTVTIPAGTTPGTHTLVLYGSSTTKAATITVQAAPAAQQQPRTLPRTGAEAWMPAALVAGTILLLAGAHLVGRSRRLTTR